MKLFGALIGRSARRGTKCRALDLLGGARRLQPYFARLHPRDWPPSDV